MKKEKEKIFCKLCNCQTKMPIDSFSRWHLKPIHNIGMKEYYDKCIKKESDGKCLVCGKDTNFINYNRGYRTYCCTLHQQQSSETSRKISESFDRRDKDVESKKRKETCLEKYGVDCVTKVREIREKQLNTVKERYRVEHNFLMESCKKARWKTLNGNKKEINEKRKKFWRNLTEEEQQLINENRKETCLEKYGVEFIQQNKEVYQKIRKTHELKGIWLEQKDKSEYQKYRHLVRLETLKHTMKVFKKWNGYDYYTGEKLKDREYYFNKIQNNSEPTQQPSIDHKISIYYGFINNIDPKIIGSYDNLCICARSTNSSKNYLTEKQFKEKLNGKFNKENN